MSKLRMPQILVYRTGPILFEMTPDQWKIHLKFHDRERVAKFLSDHVKSAIGIALDRGINREAVKLNLNEWLTQLHASYKANGLNIGNLRELRAQLNELLDMISHEIDMKRFPREYAKQNLHPSVLFRDGNGYRR